MACCGDTVKTDSRAAAVAHLGASTDSACVVYVSSTIPLAGFGFTSGSVQAKIWGLWVPSLIEIPDGNGGFAALFDVPCIDWPGTDGVELRIDQAVFFGNMDPPAVPYGNNIDYPVLFTLCRLVDACAYHTEIDQIVNTLLHVPDIYHPATFSNWNGQTTLTNNTMFPGTICEFTQVGGPVISDAGPAHLLIFYISLDTATSRWVFTIEERDPGPVYTYFYKPSCFGGIVLPPTGIYTGSGGATLEITEI